MDRASIEVVQPYGEFERPYHFLQGANAVTLHPTVKKLFYMSNEEMATRYCQRYPGTDYSILIDMLRANASYYRWAGSDLIRTIDENNAPQLTVIEMNSCPSGNESMPRFGYGYEGYSRVMEYACAPLFGETQVPGGALAVFNDVGHQLGESHAYACMLARAMNEPVYFVDIGFQIGLPENVRWTADGVCQLQVEGGAWINLRGIYRNVTRRPWTKLPLVTKTVVVNPTVACLAGGRNKLMAATAYELFNDEYVKAGLRINTPGTALNVRKCEVPEHAKRMNYKLVVKVPYNNCGVGVFTITSPKELANFMDATCPYERLIVQSMIAHKSWPSSNSTSQLYHYPFFKSAKGEEYVADIRLVICASSDGWMPVAIYSRRADQPLDAILKEDCSSWQVLGTNLSTGKDGTEGCDVPRLITFDAESFERMDLNLDDLVEGYIQTVLAATSIENQCKTLMSRKGGFDSSLFRELNPDEVLLKEIGHGTPSFACDMSIRSESLG